MTIPERPEYAKHLMYPYENIDGYLAGVTIPIEEPFDTLGQWQALTDGLIEGLKKQNQNENLEGVYSICFESTSNSNEQNSLNINRLSFGNVANTVTETLANEGFPSGTLGLLAIINEPDYNIITGTLALQGNYVPSTGKMHADRVLAGVYDDSTGKKLNVNIDADSKRVIRLLGKMMLKALDTSFNKNFGIS